jgi:LysM repeat protein
VVVVLLSSLLWAAGAALGGSEPVITHGYRVRAGDTLWTIARREVGPEGDPRRFVADVRRANGMTTSAIGVGQILVLPAA